MILSSRPLALSVLLVACSSSSPSPPSDDQDAGSPGDDDASSPGGDAGIDAAADAGGPVTPGELVETTTGPVRGVREGSVLSWKGVRYAEPPVGDGRFRPPAAVTAWDDPLEASDYGPPCMQISETTDELEGDEDCLTLNVWAPATPRDELVPVMFWIHGGDNVVGSGEEGGLYDGTWVAEHGPAVVVTINYRLGAFGWLAHPAFAGENEHGATGNYGLHDAVLALQWVHDNAARFGGDPERLLVYGQSAGASNTCALVASPLARGLFTRAAMHSLWCFTVEPETIAETNRVVEEWTDCAGNLDVASCLRAVPAERLTEAPGASLRGTTEQAEYYEVVDGWALPERPTDAIRAGRHEHMPFALGTTADEYTALMGYFLGDREIHDRADYDAILTEWFGERAAEVADAYPPADHGGPLGALTDMISDVYMHCPTREAARAAVEGQTEPVFRWVWGHGRDDGIAEELGAYHGVDVALVFHNFVDRTPSFNEEALSEQVVATWVRFADAGDPNGEAGFDWPAYDLETEPALFVETREELVERWHGETCDFWDGYDDAG
jgi:para-nitrobenzyl esterase